MSKCLRFSIVATVFGFFYVLVYYSFIGANQIISVIRWNDISDFEPLFFGVRQSPADSSKTKEVQSVKILCWILTSPQNYEKKAIHVRETWGKRCDKFLLMSSANDTNPGTIALHNTLEGWGMLWGKTKEAFKYIWEHHLNDADWFLKADDDTFVIVENLRLLLHEYKTSDPIYLGTKLKYQPNERTRGGYMAGGPGYVLSKEAVRRFVEQALPDDKKCRPGHKGWEDSEMGKCLESVGVEGINTRDEMGRNRFMIFTPEEHVNNVTAKSHSWYWTRMYFSHEKGMQMQENSEKVISFHYVTPRQMRTMDYLIYQVRPFGI